MSREISRRSRSSWSGAGGAQPSSARSTSIRTCPPGSPTSTTPRSRRWRTRWRCCCSPSPPEQPESPRRRVVVQQLGVAAPLDDRREQRVRRNEREVDGEVGEQLLVRDLGLARALLDLLGLLLQHRDHAREQRVVLEPRPRRRLPRRVVPCEYVPPRRRELHHLAGRRHPAELLGAAYDRGHPVVVHAQVLGQLEHGPPPVRTRRQVVEEAGHLRHVHPRERDEPLRSRRRLRLRQQGRRENGVQPVHHRLELRAALPARAGKRILQLLAYMPRVRAQHDDPSREEHGLLHAVRDHDERVHPGRRVAPQVHDLAPQVLGRQTVDRAEWLIHQEDLGGDGERPREADPLLHAARQLFRVSLLEPVEPHEVDGAGDGVALGGAMHAARLEAHRHILRHGEPGEEREGLEYHRPGAEHAVEPLAAVQHRPLTGARQPGEQPQQRTLAAPGRAYQRHDLLLAHRQGQIAQRLQDLPVGKAEALGHVARFEQHRIRGHVPYPKRVWAHTISDRHTTRFQPTTIRLIKAIPPASSGKLACAVASLIREPRPLVSRSPPPASMYSATIEPFHAPPAAVTHPVTSAGNAAGRYRVRHRATVGSRNTVATSLSCSGVPATAEITLNRTYHWPARTISATAPRPSPTPMRSNSRTTIGKSIGAGNDATTWMTGCSARASRGERPITTPA